MDKQKLGHLEKVDLRTYWKDESRDFTPWLAQDENIALLGEAIDMSLEVNSVEKNVGPYFADILCRDIARDKWVVIENQLEKTDHSHLGQSLTYAAGLDAETVIWVAPKFTSEHRAALDWLNESTAEHLNFFGVEIELWRIGDSAPAPKFNIVCQPNDWAKAIRASAQQGELAGARLLQLEFWTGFTAFMEGRSSVRCQKPLPQTWMNHAIGRTGIRLSSIASTFDSVTSRFGGEIRVELGIETQSSKNHFAQLEAQKREVEAEIGEPLTWYNPSEVRTCRIYVRQSVDLENRTKWSEYFVWLKTKLEAFARVLGPRVKALED